MAKEDVPSRRATPGLRLLPSGAWQARYSDPSGRRRAQTFRRKSDAIAFLAAAQTDVRRGEWIDPARGRASFEELARTWFANKLDLRASSRARDESYLRNHVLPAFGSTAVGQIARSDVQEFVRALSEKGLAPLTVRQCHQILRAILAVAVEDRILLESPCRRISLPRVDRHEHPYLTTEEVERLGAAVDPAFRALVYSAVYLGCRWGELVGLKRQHLDLLRRQVKIVGSLEEVAGRLAYAEETKRVTSRRTLTIPPFLCEMLAEHLAAAPAGEFVFTGRDGGLLRRSGFRRRHWKPALSRAGLNDELRFHDLRHTCASLLIARGAHPREIMARLGHASITTTLNTYGHLWPSLGDKLDEALEDAYRQVAGSNGSNGARSGHVLGTRVVPMLRPRGDSGP